MTTIQAGKIARRKLSLLQLAQELGNVSKACRIVGYSRQQFCEIRRARCRRVARPTAWSEGTAPESRTGGGRSWSIRSTAPSVWLTS